MNAIVTTTEERSIAALTDDPKNARQHSEAQIAQIVNSIERFGYVAPIIIQPSGQIIGGHATLAALKRLGRTDIDCRVVHGLKPAAYKALALALNKIPENSRWNDNVLREVLGELEQEGNGELHSIGFSTSELNKLLGEASDLEVREIETGAVDDEFWISIRGPLAEQANALRALQDAMRPFSGVSVEQGTIAIG